MKSHVNLNSNSNEVQVRRINVTNQPISINSRTKTASFSQNGYSEEVFKISQHLREEVNERVIVEGVEEVQAALGSMEINANHVSVPFISQAKSLGRADHIQGKDSARSSQETDTALPGFEVLQVNRGKKQAKSQSKSKYDRGVVRSDNKDAQSSSSNETTESMLKLAQESIQVGELLGVQVIGNKQAAVDKITEHLKKKKTQSKNSHKLSKK